MFHPMLVNPRGACKMHGVQGTARIQIISVSVSPINGFLSICILSVSAAFTSANNICICCICGPHSSDPFACACCIYGLGLPWSGHTCEQKHQKWPKIHQKSKKGPKLSKCAKSYLYLDTCGSRVALQVLYLYLFVSVGPCIPLYLWLACNRPDNYLLNLQQ